MEVVSLALHVGQYNLLAFYYNSKVIVKCGHGDVVVMWLCSRTQEVATTASSLSCNNYCSSHVCQACHQAVTFSRHPPKIGDAL